MRALVVGRGSMGKRRIRDLRALGVEVSSWDVTDRLTMPDDQFFDAVVVSTPPLTKHLFVQSPSARAQATFTEADVEGLPGPHRRPSCTPRFVPAIVRIKERIDRGEIGRPVAYTHHVGQNLLDWHPGADLSSYYAAKRETGACREMVPFELGWLTWIFGPVTKAKALRGRLAGIGSLAGIAPIDDVYQVVVEHDRGTPVVLGHLLIDAVSRPARREIHVVGTAGSFTQEIRFTEAAYLAEMRAFVKSVEEGAPWPYSVEEERANLEVLRLIERD